MNNYVAQYAQDRFLNEVIFKNKKNGFFLDIGAHDGITYSNSYFFEKNLAWNGVCIEPIPEVFNKLNNNRNCIKENAAITSSDGKVKFTRITGYAEMLSGVSESYDEKHLERIAKETKEHNCSVEEIEVTGLSLSTLFSKYAVSQIDFVSIDTEGNEYPIISNFPFHIIKPKVFAVENNYKDNKVSDALKKQGYTRLAKFGDDFYYRDSPNFTLWFGIFLFRLRFKFKLFS